MSLLFDNSLSFSLYFANSGLKTRLNLLNTFRAWWTLAILIILASVSKIVPVTIATKICARKSWYYCASMGVLMNTRGIVQLVVLNIGVQLKVISPVIFAMFVLMATILTILTSPVLSILSKRDSDPKILEESKTAYDLHSVLEGEDNVEKSKEEIATISTGENPIMSLRKISRNENLSISSNPRLSSPRIITNGREIQSTINENAKQRRHSRMTLF
jgi:hypothetical protein